MKLVKIISIIALLTMAGFLSQARAAYLSVTPAGSFDAQAETSITYDIFFNVEAGESFSLTGWDLDLQYDNTELANWASSNVLAGGISESAADTLRFSFFSLIPVNLATPDSYQMASVTFDILNPLQLFDGMADFSVLSQLGTAGASFRGFTTATFTTFQLDGALGADVGAVPIPGAVWLFGSGLAGLIGLRRKKKG